MVSLPTKISWFLGIEAIAFITAALVHYGAILPDHTHLKAAVAESVIALALVAGLALSRAHAGCPRKLGIAAQAFALLGTCVGLFTIIIGIGPQSVGDLAFHGLIVCVLVWGLVVAWRGAGGAAPGKTQEPS